MVPETGIEPVRPLFTKRRILSPMCLPISPLGLGGNLLVAARPIVVIASIHWPYFLMLISLLTLLTPSTFDATITARSIWLLLLTKPLS